MVPGNHAIFGRSKVKLVIDVWWVSGSCGENRVGWEKFQVDSVWCEEVGVVVVVWVAVVFNEYGFDEQGWFVLPFVVDEGDEANALYPQPQLSGGLWLIILSDV